MTRSARLLALGLLAGALAAPALASGETMADTLAGLAGEYSLKLTTVGRKSGQPRTADIWFVVEGDHLFVQAGKKARTGWLVNIKHRPDVELEIRGTKFHGRAAVVAGPSDRQRILALFRQKYWRAWLGSFIGSSIGAGVPVRITVTGAK
jgi:deazaflavin-dependent oxidoreductase (nitroreductase family)